jgi:hypothetical protein
MSAQLQPFHRSEQRVTPKRSRVYFCVLALCACSANQQSESEEVTLGTTTEPLVFYDSSCTAPQQDKIQTSDALSLVGAKAASRSVGNNALYRRWFGTYNSSRAADVQDVIDDAVAGWALHQGDCNDPSSLCSAANAYVSGTGPMHLCAGALNAPSSLRMHGSGTANTLFHERVHIVSAVTDESNAVCTDGPDTGCSGYFDDLDLAATSPTEAVNNADNYELFIVEAYAGRVIKPAQAILFL